MPDQDDTINIRFANAADIPPIVELIRPFVVADRVLERTTAELDDLIPNAFVAECELEIVGFAALEVYSRKLAEVRSLAVADGFQGRGLGSQLVGACVERARDLEILEVLAVTSEEAFFRSCGFDFTLPGEKKALFIQPNSGR